MQCTDKSKRSGRQCERWALEGFTVCPMHGAGSRKRVMEGRRKSTRLVTKPIAVNNFQYPVALLSRQRPAMAAPSSRCCPGTLLSVVRGPCHAQRRAGRLNPNRPSVLRDHLHQSFSPLCFSSIPRISETFFCNSTSPSARWPEPLAEHFPSPAP